MKANPERHPTWYLGLPPWEHGPLRDYAKHHRRCPVCRLWLEPDPESVVIAHMEIHHPMRLFLGDRPNPLPLPNVERLK